MTLWMGHSYYAVPFQLYTLNKNEQNMQVIGYVQTYVLVKLRHLNVFVDKKKWCCKNANIFF